MQCSVVGVEQEVVVEQASSWSIVAATKPSCWRHFSDSWRKCHPSIGQEGTDEVLPEPC